MQNNAPFIGSISKINNALINNAEDLDVVMSMYSKRTAKVTETQQVVCGIITEMN